MSRKTDAPAPGAITVGLPRALLFHRYEYLWQSFFYSLGAKVLVSPPTNKEILRIGTEAAIDEACLSTKIYMGHVRELIGKCDYILVPRISTFGLNREMCMKFAALYDLVCATFRGTGQKFLAYNIDIKKKLTEEKAFLEMGTELGYQRKLVQDAYKRADKYEQEEWKKKVKAQELLYKEPGLKIMVAAHSYIIQDEYVGKPVTDYLKELGCIPLRGDVVKRKDAIKQSPRVSRTLKWELSREIVGNLYMHRDKIDGIVLLSAFPCGPDSMVNETIIRQFKGIPILNLVLDSQSGTAGMETRLESFADILKFKKGTL